MLLLQLLMSFTKQIWLFLFHLLYPCGHFNTIIRGEEEALEPYQVRVVFWRRMALLCPHYSPAGTPLSPQTACVRLFLHTGLMGLCKPLLFTLLHPPQR